MKKSETRSCVKPVETKVGVTYQRLAGRWYAFSEHQGEIYFGEIPEKTIPYNNVKNRKAA